MLDFCISMGTPVRRASSGFATQRAGRRWREERNEREERKSLQAKLHVPLQADQIALHLHHNDNDD